MDDKFDPASPVGKGYGTFGVPSYTVPNDVIQSCYAVHLDVNRPDYITKSLTGASPCLFFFSKDFVCIYVLLCLMLQCIFMSFITLLRACHAISMYLAETEPEQKNNNGEKIGGAPSR